jgi:nucleoside-diphosphate-sugar epimerase
MTLATVFVTGATGTIGRFLVARLSARGHRVIALVRGAAARSSELRTWVADHGGEPSRVEALEGDLVRPSIVADDAALADVEFVFHAGAAANWGLKPDVAHETNVCGTERMLGLARSLPRLRRFVLVSGYGVGLVPDGARVPGGQYEVTKVEADRRTRAFARTHHLPLTRVHPGAVIGDSTTGEMLSTFGFGDLALAIARGDLLAIPGGLHHRMPLVTVDYVADFLARVPFSDVDTPEYYLLDQASPDIATLVHRISRHAGVRSPTRRVPLGLAKLLARATRDPAQIEGLHFITDLSFDTRAADDAAAAHDLVKPDIRLAIERSVMWLRSNEWAPHSEVRTHDGLSPTQQGVRAS